MPITQPRLARAKDAARFFDEIRRGDLLVHQPYESFRTSFEAFAGRRGGRPRRDRDEDGRLPHVATTARSSRR